MIRALVRRDADLRYLKWGLTFAAGLGLWLGWIFRMLLDDEAIAVAENQPYTASSRLLLAGAMSLSLLAVLLALGGRKTHAFMLALPVTAPRLVQARWCLLVLTFATPLILYYAIAAACAADAIWTVRFALLTADAILGFAAALALSFHVRPRRSTVPLAINALLLLALFPALTWTLQTAGSWIARAAVALAAAGLLAGLVLRTPTAFRVEPTAEEASLTRTVARRPLRRLLLNHVLFSTSALVMMSVLAFLVLLFTGVSGRITFLGWMPIAIFWLMSPIAANASVVRRTDLLPINRRAVFLYVMLPVLGTLALAAAAAVPLKSELLRVSDTGFSRESGIVRLGWSFTADVLGRDIEIPPRFWLRSQGGGEWIESPDGTRVFSPTRTFLGDPTSFYNPYHFGKDTSAEFRAWQIARALLDVHQLDLSAEEILRRGMPDGRGWSALDLEPPTTLRLVLPRLLLALASWTLIALLGARLAFLSAKPAQTVWGQRARTSLVLTMLAVFMAVLILAEMAVHGWLGRDEEFASYLLEDALARNLPLHLLAWAAWSVFAVLGWRWLRRVFERVEMASVLGNPHELTPRQMRWLRL
jgi:hypothetical protein